MVVWVLLLSFYTGAGSYANTSTTVVDNIATAESCEQLAQVARGHGFNATCAPVRKVAVK